MSGIIPEKITSSPKWSISGWYPEFWILPQQEGYGFTFDYYTSSDYSKDGEVTTLQSATIGNGIDIVLMGDAYSDRLIANGTYDQVMNKAMEKIFSVEPYKSYREYFNVYAVKVVSENEEYGIASVTALDCSFDGGTLVSGNDTEVVEYATKAIGEERMDEALVVVMMNSTNYAGTCYMYHPEAGDYGNGLSISYFPVGADDTALEQIIHHEAAGHGFAKLGDEYAYEEYGAIPESDITYARGLETYGWLKNVDFTSDPNSVKWSKFLSDSRYANDGLGVYEGAYTYWTGAYRPTENSIMRYNTGGYNAPSREAIYYRINKLAYGEAWEYDYEKFVEYDAINRTSTVTRTIRDYKPMEPLHEPVIIKGSWRDALRKKISTRTLMGSKKRSQGSTTRQASGTASPVIRTMTYTTKSPDGRVMTTTTHESGKTTVSYKTGE
ncbi:MAG: hypothetical protein IJ494_03180 [Bacteroides sp.]|nr:hypothetical protein [Bacteroides sp.]